MAEYRYGLSLVVVVMLVSAAWSQPSPTLPPRDLRAATAVDTSSPITKVYSLAELGDDPNLCKWVAETIPQMIQPGSWSNVDGKKNLSFYAPGKVIVICHTPAVHAQVDDFIQGLKKAMPPRAAHHAHVVPAQVVVADVPRVGPTVASQAYPIPQTPMAPKHLFHFIIRYEGEGIIDSNVTQFAKALADASRGGNSATESSAGPITLPTPMYLKNTPSDTAWPERYTPAVGVPYGPAPKGTNSVPPMMPPADAPTGPSAYPSPGTPTVVPPAASPLPPATAPLRK